MKPITPREAIAQFKESIPDAVIDCFNRAIVKGLRPDGSSRVTQEYVTELISNALSVSNQRVLDNRWLDIEKIYESAGWVVEYHNPGYDENWKPYYTFSEIPL